MRRDILHPGAGSLRYEIREIAAAARAIEALGRTLVWENIGDPVAKGEVPPRRIRDVVSDLVHQPESWGYCDTPGVPRVRAFLGGGRPFGIRARHLRPGAGAGVGFQSSHHGFRGTLLESDADRRRWIFRTLRESIDDYVASG